MWDWCVAVREQCRRIELFAERRESANILKQDAHFALLAFEWHAAREHCFRNIARDEAAEGVFHMLALFESVHHFIERAREESDLVLSLDARAIAEVPAHHFVLSSAPQLNGDSFNSSLLKTN